MTIPAGAVSATITVTPVDDTQVEGDETVVLTLSADPAYDVVHASMVPCLANLLAALRGEGVAETTGEDNLQTLRLVFAAYDSAQRGQVIPIREEG